ncbi:MAG: hypothetical protein ABI120_25130, partial [Gemmatimonadaceae bacterium]
PANAYALPVAGGAIDPLTRPRGPGAMLFTRAGKVVMTAERKGSRLRIAENATETDVRNAAEAFILQYAPAPGTLKRNDTIVETIDGDKATRSKWSAVLREAGMSGLGGAFRF